MAHLELHAWLLVPTGVLALEEMAEEALLQLHAVIGVELGPVLDAMRFEPFLRRRRAPEALEIAAGMQALATPIGGGEQGRGDLRPHRRARLVVVVVERTGENLVAENAAVACELRLAQRPRPADELAGDAALGPMFPQPVLHRAHLHVVPVGPEGREHPAMVRHLPVPVPVSLPHAPAAPLLPRHLPALPPA